MDSEDAAAGLKSEVDPTDRVAPGRSVSSAIGRLVRVSVPSDKRCDIMSLNPGKFSGSFASPDRKASRKLIKGSRLSSISTNPKPFESVVPNASGRLSGRAASGGGISRRKVSACIVVFIKDSEVTINSIRLVAVELLEVVCRRAPRREQAELAAAAPSVDRAR